MLNWEQNRIVHHLRFITQADITDPCYIHLRKTGSVGNLLPELTYFIPVAYYSIWIGLRTRVQVGVLLGVSDRASTMCLSRGPICLPGFSTSHHSLPIHHAQATSGFILSCCHSSHCARFYVWFIVIKCCLMNGRITAFWHPSSNYSIQGAAKMLQPGDRPCARTMYQLLKAR